MGIPGTFCAPSMFDPLKAALAVDDGANVALTTVGWMERHGPWDLPSVARAIADDLRHDGDGPVIVVGHSTGGAIALQLAASWPDLVAGLVLVNTGPDMSQHGDVGTIIDGVRGPDAGTVLAAVLDRSFAEPPAEAVRRRLLAYARGLDPQVALEVLRSQKATDLGPTLRNITCPTAVVHGVHGVHDPVRTAAAAEVLAGRIRGATLTLLDCGHSPPYEAPQELAKVVRSVLRAADHRSA